MGLLIGASDQVVWVRSPPGEVRSYTGLVSGQSEVCLPELLIAQKGALGQNGIRSGVALMGSGVVSGRASGCVFGRGSRL